MRHRIPDRLLDVPLRQRRVDDDAARGLGGGDSQEGAAQRLVEVERLSLEPVRRPAAAATRVGTRQPHLGRQVENQR